ncbi:hypothetical protein [Williamwhitmania taraxaci]|uniref:Uncharacterized protein n=1 Tax=Williamwhitmania taraxaci TaxID=1640674 RepID=A0A1G6MAP3_9BACT|nr:hypothetical protein [Williamwhitmania taraxaci]SDC52354.1 hypothetical protein SAMN05216323_103514 [Williamwhitmania taraxaci]
MKWRWLLALVVLLAGVLAGWKLKPTPAPYPVTVTKTVTLPGDSIPYPVAVAVPIPRDSVVIDTLWRDVDTVAILRRFFTQYTYNDTIRDSSFVAILREVVAQNQIVERQLSVQNLRSTAVTYTTTVETPPPRWYVGGFASYGDQPSAGITLLYARKNNAVGITADPFNRSAGVVWLHAIR